MLVRITLEDAKMLFASKKARANYEPEVKDALCELIEEQVLEGATVKDVCEELGAPYKTVLRWFRENMDSN